MSERKNDDGCAFVVAILLAIAGPVIFVAWANMNAPYADSYE